VETQGFRGFILSAKGSSMMKLPVKGLYRMLMYDTKLRHKILLTYFVLIIIPLGLFLLLVSSKMSVILEQHVHYSAQQGFQQAYSFLKYKLEKISEISGVIVLNPGVLNAMEKQALRTSYNDQLEDYNTLRRFLRALQNDDAPRIILSVDDALVYADDKENFERLGADDQSACAQRLVREKDTFLWCSPAELDYADGVNYGHVYLVRNVRHSNNYRLPIARVKLEIENKTILAILKGSNVVRGSVSYLITPDKDVVLASGDLPESDLRMDLPQLDSSGTASIQSADRIYLYQQIPASQWTMVTSIPLTAIVHESRIFRNELLAWGIGITTVAYLIAILFSHSITRRISLLIRRLRSIDTRSTVFIGRMGGKDEIGELFNTYNTMINRIDEMNRDQFKLGQEVKNAELKALQSQINPHFLYNTLDMINWMAVQGRTKDIQRIIKTLSRFYKLALNNGKDIISIRDELSHASSYLEIQNARFENKIVFQTDIEEELLDYGIPKITLQPIIENAVYHGILGRRDRAGTVSVTVKRSGTNILITVKDDGIGMNAQPQAAGSTGSGYGIRNVKLRILTYFGEAYGVVHRSAPGEGTTVEILIPAVNPVDNPT
jgi:two-component system sensor histidine kinase YesM